MKNLKKVLALTAVLSVLFSVSVFAAPALTIDGAQIDVPTIYWNSKVYVPVEESVNNLGITLSYADSNTVVATEKTYNVSVKFSIANGVPTINGKPVDGNLLDLNGKYYAPVLTIANALGARVEQVGAYRLNIYTR
ncbi:MAG: copper amine oxidase N-terminal domain-containing protein [Clostridiales bacterium]|jgi:hypothetical protein|nr:copper amine oxidase N-terminal domain-containing protein [Clostridiales bacterium]